MNFMNCDCSKMSMKESSTWETKISPQSLDSGARGYVKWSKDELKRNKKSDIITTHNWAMNIILAVMRASE